MSWARLQKAQDANSMVKDIFLEHISIQNNGKAAQWNAKTNYVWTALKNTRGQLQLHFLQVTAELTPYSLSSYPYMELILKECTNCFLWLWWRWLNLPIMQAIPETSKTTLTDEKQCFGNSLGGISKNLSFWRSRLRLEGDEYEFDVIFAQVLHCESTNNHSCVHRRGKSNRFLCSLEKNCIKLCPD